MYVCIHCISVCIVRCLYCIFDCIACMFVLHVCLHFICVCMSALIAYMRVCYCAKTASVYCPLSRSLPSYLLPSLPPSLPPSFPPSLPSSVPLSLSPSLPTSIFGSVGQIVEYSRLAIVGGLAADTQPARGCVSACATGRSEGLSCMNAERALRLLAVAARACERLHSVQPDEKKQWRLLHGWGKRGTALLLACAVMRGAS
jgi:hypothetical protein